MYLTTTYCINIIERKAKQQHEKWSGIIVSMRDDVFKTGTIWSLSVVSASETKSLVRTFVIYAQSG